MDAWELKERQALPLDTKINMSLERIKEWYEYWGGNVFTSVSGGLSSKVSYELVKMLYGDSVPAVNSMTGLEPPGNKRILKTMKNVVYVKPKMFWPQVIATIGYPVVSKEVSRYVWDLRRPPDINPNTQRLRLTGITKSGKKSSKYLPKKWYFLLDAPFLISDKCCTILKEEPLNRYSRETGRKCIDGILATESRRRKLTYLQYGCNRFNLGEPKSSPISFWTPQDVLRFIKEFNIPYSEEYGDIVEENGILRTTGEERTGCMFCMFGVHMEKGQNRFQRMKLTHPVHYKYCMEKLGLARVLDYIGVPY